MALPSKFQVGQCSSTPAALAMILNAGDNPIQYIARHQSGDWGDVTDNDRAANEAALIPDADGEFPDKVMSVYHLRDADHTKIYVITEWDRSVTTILLPGEY